MPRFTRENLKNQDIPDPEPVREAMQDLGGQAEEYLPDDRDERVSFRDTESRSIKKLVDIVLRHS